MQGLTTRRQWLALAGASLASVPLSATERPWQGVTLPASRQLDVRSRDGLDYRLFVSVPADPAPPGGYPVLYVLDGNAAFPVAAFLARSAAKRREVTGHLPLVVVGVGYPGDEDFDIAARRRDYTPGRGRPPATATEGGADRFLDFLLQELQPLVASTLPVNAQRQTLFGHSFGGLFVLHALLTRPQGFATYLASSPSIWWNERQVLEGLPRLAARPAAAAPRLQLSVGALEDDTPKGHYSAEVRAMLAARPMVSEARQLARHLASLPQWQGRWVYHELAGEDHGPAWLPALSRGVQFALEQP